MPTKEKHSRLRPGYSAAVRTTEEVVVATLAGNVKQQAIVNVRAGGELPDDLAPGEYERLAKLGAFDPLPSRAERGLVEATPQHVLNNTAPPGEAVTTPSDIRELTAEETSAQERLAKAQEDVRAAFAEADAEAEADAPIPGEEGAAGFAVSHEPAEGDAVAADTKPKPARTPRKKSTRKASSARKR